MKILQINDKSVLIRHWFKWYLVTRNGAKWQPVAPIVRLGRPPKPLDPIAFAAASLMAAGKGGEAVDISE